VTIGEIIDRALRYSDTADRRAGLQAVNDILRELFSDAGWAVTTSTVTTTTSANNYDLSAAPFSMASIDRILLVEHLQSGSQFTRTLMQQTPDWIADATSTLALGLPGAYAIQGEDTLLLDGTVPVGDVFVIRWVPQPAEYTSESSTPTELASRWHRVVAWGAAAELAGGEDVALMERLSFRYAALRGEYKAWLSKRRGMPKRVQTGYPDRRSRWPRDPSTDLG
jgi:hypothetical protein